MAPINTKNVHRSNFLSGHPHGSGFVYDEMMVAPRIGEIARVTTETLATVVSFIRNLRSQSGMASNFGPAMDIGRSVFLI
jgi:hypothetical protein